MLRCRHWYVESREKRRITQHETLWTVTSRACTHGHSPKRMTNYVLWFLIVFELIISHMERLAYLSAITSCHLILALDFSMPCSVCILHSNIYNMIWLGKWSTTSQTLTARYNRATTTNQTFQVSIDITLTWRCDTCIADTHRTHRFGTAWDFQSGVHKYLHTWWNSLLPRCLRMSDLTPQNFRPVPSYTFTPSVSRNGVRAVSSAALSVQTESPLFAPKPLFTASINTADLIGSAVLEVMFFWRETKELKEKSLWPDNDWVHPQNEQALM